MRLRSRITLASWTHLLIGLKHPNEYRQEGGYCAGQEADQRIGKLPNIRYTSRLLGNWAVGERNAQE